MAAGRDRPVPPSVEGDAVKRASWYATMPTGTAGSGALVAAFAIRSAVLVACAPKQHANVGRRLQDQGGHPG